MDVGPVVAESIYVWFHDLRNIKFLEKVRGVGVVIQHDVEQKQKVGKFNGKTFVLTGSFSSMSREEAKEKVRVLGGEISESVSQRTAYVVVGENPGSKYEKAKELGIAILGEKAFLAMLN